MPTTSDPKAEARKRERELEARIVAARKASPEADEFHGIVEDLMPGFTQRYFTLESGGRRYVREGRTYAYIGEKFAETAIGMLGICFEEEQGDFDDDQLEMLFNGEPVGNYGMALTAAQEVLPSVDLRKLGKLVVAIAHRWGDIDQSAVDYIGRGYR